jgi:hypothetical protein
MKSYITLDIRFDENGEITGDTFEAVEKQLVKAEGADAFYDLTGVACALCAGFEDRKQAGESLCLEFGDTYYLGHEIAEEVAHA